MSVTQPYTIVQRTQRWTIDPRTRAVYRECIIRTADGQLWEAGVRDDLAGGDL